MSRLALAFSSITLLATLGCTKILPPLTAPEDGGPAWRELVSKHIILRTDRSEEDAKEALVDLERSYVVLHDVAFPQVNVEGSRIVVVHFDRQRDFNEFAPMNSAGSFRTRLPNDLDDEPTMLVWGKLDISARQTLNHELSRMFIQTSLGGAPPWFNEGLAEYYETVELENGFAFVGRPLLKRRAWTEKRWVMERRTLYEIAYVPVNKIASVNDLVRMDGSKFYVWTDRGRQPTMDEEREQITHLLGAYTLVHLIMHTPEYQAKFDEMMELVGKGMSIRQAWDKTFALLDGDKLEVDYRQHMLNKYETMVLKTPFPAPQVTPEQDRLMTPGEIHLLWARLRPWAGADAARAEADISAAKRQSPDSPEVLFYSGLFRAAKRDLAGAETDIKAALAVKPHEARYLHGLVHLYGQMEGPQAADKLKSAVERLSKAGASGRALHAIAQYHEKSGRMDDALTFAERSAQADPTCAVCFSSLGEILFAKQRYSDAARVQQIALSLLPDSGQDPAEEAKLRKYTEAVFSQPAAPVPSAPAPAPAPSTPPP